MDVAASALWIVTALGGAAMAGIWLAHRGAAQHREGISRLSLGRVASHAALAAIGLLLWIIHVASDSTAAGWVAFALLPLAAALGLLLFMTWLAGRGAAATEATPAEQRIPPVIVAAHGLFAVLTVVTVLIALL